MFQYSILNQFDDMPADDDDSIDEGVDTSEEVGGEVEEDKGESEGMDV